MRTAILQGEHDAAPITYEDDRRAEQQHSRGNVTDVVRTSGCKPVVTDVLWKLVHNSNRLMIGSPIWRVSAPSTATALRRFLGK